MATGNKETKAEREAREKAEKIDAAISTMSFQDEPNTFVDQLLDQAEALNTEKEELYERIGANRETLRNILKTGLLTEGQARDALEVYPPVARGGENGTEAAAS